MQCGKKIRIRRSLLISGTIGEHAAIECLRCGATDYVLKNKLERLAPTVRRAIKEAEGGRIANAPKRNWFGAKIFRTLTSIRSMS